MREETPQKIDNNPFTNWKTGPSIWAKDKSFERSAIASKNKFKFTPAPLNIIFKRKD